MRGWMQTKLEWILVVIVCATLASCLVGKSKKVNTYKIPLTPDSTLDTKLPMYAHGDVITMQYESYMVGSSPQSTSTGITMRWEESALPLPFHQGLRSVMRFVFQELGASTVQYITQDADGSIFLHAFEGIGSTPGSQTHTFWPNKDTTLTANTKPSSVQIFWSPLDPGRGIDRAAVNALDYYIVGECNDTSCGSVATMQASTSGAGFKITDAPGNALQFVTTPLGNFETYNIHYAGTLTVNNSPTSFQPTMNFDYRASCLLPGQNGIATFEGEMWIYPPIGPVKIRNYCSPSGSSTLTPISYTALITGTNLPFP